MRIGTMRGRDREFLALTDRPRTAGINAPVVWWPFASHIISICDVSLYGKKWSLFLGCCY